MAKTAWLEAMKIAVHDFWHIHKCSPEQRTITENFTTCHVVPPEAQQVDWNVAALDTDNGPDLI
eukprot:4324858-Ditylum_brightwellii.AAC.1